jgi:ubiquinone/menaquinone biosynthesis C-methylase UbiE
VGRSDPLTITYVDLLKFTFSCTRHHSSLITHHSPLLDYPFFTTCDKQIAMADETLREWQVNASYWAKHAEMVRKMFAPLTAALLQEAGIHEGQSILDVAGGTGEPSLTIARQVGPSGSVMCTDAVAEMTAAARAEAERTGLSNIQVRQCLADSLPFPDNTFDVTVSRLGVMFFPDPQAGLKEMLRVTKPGGRVSLAVWHKSEINPFCYLVTKVLSRHVETAPEDPDAPSAFRFAEPGKLARVLSAAGAVEVKERVLEFLMEAPLTPAEFWVMRSGMSGTLREKLETLPSTEREEIATEVQQAVTEFFPNNQMSFPTTMIIVSGTKPSL